MRLQDWLKRERCSKVNFAKRIDVPVSTINRIISESRSPTHQIMKRIIDATDGEVLPNDFFDLSRVPTKGRAHGATGRTGSKP